MPRCDRRGVTLFESVAALAIVSLTASAALAAVGSELRTAERARRAIEAAALMTQRLDFLNLLTDQELQALPDSVKSGKFAAPFSDYAWQASAGAVSGTAGVYEVVTSVTWPKNSYTVRTYQYRRPPLAGTTQ